MIANPYFLFWGTVLGVWTFRTLRLLITLRKTPRIVPQKGTGFSGETQSLSPFVSVLIPAKNEENNIRACVESLQNQKDAAFEIIVINDNSSDQTESILKSMGQTYVNCPLPPEGWTGKNHALHYGVAQAKGEWLLFTDADTRHEPHGLSASLAHAQKNGLELLTLLPSCLTGSFIENLVQPLAMAFLGLWFPLEKVNDPKSPLYFANGQYLLMKRSLYQKTGGHKAVAGEFLEDFALMQKTKQLGAKAQCGFGQSVYGTRMYDSFDTIWRGWRRIYLHAFQRKPLTLVRKALVVLVFSVLPFALYAFSHGGHFSTLVIAVLVVICWRAYTVVRAKGAYALFHPLAALIIFLILTDAARMAFLKEKTFWR